MQNNFYYFSLSFSAIQKVVLRHDRLWSMAGMSQLLSRLNEVELPRITRENGGAVIVAGGGKFTARFDNDKAGKRARSLIIKAVSTTLPMLEFQFSDFVSAASFRDAREKEGLIQELSEQKARFRGYGASFNPHLKLCDECGEYPAVERLRGKDWVCSCCHNAYLACNDLDLAGISRSKEEDQTSIQRVYRAFIGGMDEQTLDCLNIPANFENLFGASGEGDLAIEEANTAAERKRMGVWFSDLNHMSTKVRIWLSQPEDDVQGIFSKVKSNNISLAGNSLRKTFLPLVKTLCAEAAKGASAAYLPFRLVVAGGDDLCIVMAEKYILKFILNLNAEFQKLKLDAGHPLNDVWLEQHRDTSTSSKIQPYCFGGSFVVTPIHTPFRKVHEVGEDLMSQAKEKTGRAANSVNWRVLGVDIRPEAGPPVEFEKPLFIESCPVDQAPSETAGRLSFMQYLELADFYRGVLSRSQRQQVISEIIAGGDGKRLEAWVMKVSSGGLEKGLKYLLVDERFREGQRLDGELSCARIATLLELMSIANGDSDDE